MENDAFYELWEGTLNLPNDVKINNYAKTYDSAELLLNMCKSCKNLKTQSLILNSFLNFLKDKNFSYDVITQNLYGQLTPIIKTLLLNKDFHITEKDEALFLYGQDLFDPSDKLVQKEQNLSNEHYNFFIKKHNIIINQPTFDDLFNSALKMFPKTKKDTFDDVNSYIETNKTTWYEQTNKFKNQKLLQKYNDQLLKKLTDWNISAILENPKNTEPLKYFIKISKMTTEGTHKHKGLIQNFIPWFVKNADKDMWEEFTQNFELKNEINKEKIAVELLLSANANSKTSQLLIYQYKNPFYKMIINHTSNDRILWFNKNYLENALKHTKISNSVTNVSQALLSLKIKFTSIPEYITQDNLKFTIWLNEEKVLSNEEFDNIMPILLAHDLDRTIPIINTPNKTNKI